MVEIPEIVVVTENAGNFDNILAVRKNIEITLVILAIAGSTSLPRKEASL